MRISAEEMIKGIPDYQPETIQALKKWLDENPHYPPTSEECLILFAHSCYYDVEKTKSCIDHFYNLVSSTPEFFKNRVLDQVPNLTHIMTVTDSAIFPKLTPNGYQIVFDRLSQFEPNKYVCADGLKVFIMTMEAARYSSGAQNGYYVLFDMTGVRLGHLLRLNLGLLRKFFVFIQDANPIRLKGIHVVNTLPILDNIMVLIKPFIKKELYSLLHFYSPSKLDKLYEVIPRECLPPDFGGSLEKTVAELHADTVELWGSMKHYWADQDTLVINEALRPRKKDKKSARREPVSDIRRLEID